MNTACSVCCKEPATERLTLKPDNQTAAITITIGTNCHKDLAIDGPVTFHRWIGRMAKRQQQMIAAANDA